MNGLLKCLLITVMPIYISGCSIFEPPTDVEYFTPVKDLSINIGESAIVHGAMESCGREARAWVDIEHLLPYSQTGFFSNAGRNLMKSDKCGGNLASVLAVRFTANKLGSESLTVFGDPLNITVGNNVNFLQSAINPNPQKTESSGSSIFKTISEWIAR